MAQKSPFDMSQLAELFDPKNTASLYDPNALQSWFASISPEGLDAPKLMAQQNERLTAINEANSQAAIGYQKLVRRHGEIFEEIMGAAKAATEKLDLTASPNAPARNQEIYSKAMSSAGDLMKQLSEETQVAVESAYTDVTARVQEAVEELSNT